MIKQTLVLLLFLVSLACAQVKQGSIPVSAPVTIDSPGKMGAVAAQSVMRIICTKTNMGGSGFLHKSGWILTAAHVVVDCSKANILVLLSTGEKIDVDSVITDTYADLAALKPSKKIDVPALALSSKTEIITGSLVTTWGFPSGYNGFRPLLTVGYLSGVDRVPTPAGLSPTRWVVNAAFNGGNSGGPVLDIETGDVIGVVSSKLAPIPLIIESAMEALSTQKSGFSYTQTNEDGTTTQVSEGHVIAEVLKYLRSQTQLVLGHAVTSTDLLQFLRSHSISN